MVAVPAVDRDVAALVDRGAHDVPHARERLGGQRGHGRAVSLEQLAPRRALVVVRCSCGGVAAAQEPGVERRDVVDRGDRREQVLAAPVDLALDVALLVAGAGVGVRRLEAVVGPHPREQLGLGHLRPAPAPGSGRVVEDDPRGHAADVLEDVAQPLADALAGLAGEQLAEGHVREGEAQHEQVHPDGRPGDLDVDVAEIGLRLAGAPDELHVLGAAGRDLGPAPAHVVLHSPVAALVGRLLHEPLVYPPRAVALLAPDARVVVEDRVDEGLVGVEDRWPRLRLRHQWREVVHREVFPDGGLRDARPPLDLGVGEPPARHLPYTFHYGHADHPFRLLCDCQLVAATTTVGLAGRHAFAIPENFHCQK